MKQKMDYLNDSKYDERRTHKVPSATGYAKTPIFKNISNSTQIRNKWPTAANESLLKQMMGIHSTSHMARLQKTKKGRVAISLVESLEL